MTRPPAHTAGSLALWAIASLVAAHPAFGVVNPVSCVQARGGNSCTANDVTFVVVGLGVQDDGCVNANDPNDTLSIFLGAQVQNTTAQTRYDIGLFVATDGGLDAFAGSQCAAQALLPAGIQSDTSCTYDTPPGSLNLAADGPFYNSDADTCGDLMVQQPSATCDSDGDGLWDDSFVEFDGPITVPCSDLPIIAPTGFVDLGTCATWGNQQNQVDGPDAGQTCDNENELRPGTGSKCACQSIDTDVPAAQLALSCECLNNFTGAFTTDPISIFPGTSAECRVRYTNNAACTPDPSDPERFRCGTASFISYRVEDDQSGMTDGEFTVLDDGRGSNSGTPGQVNWLPASVAGTAAVIPPGETDTLSFRYLVDPDATGAITLTATTVFANAGTCSATTTRACQIDGDCPGGETCTADLPAGNGFCSVARTTPCQADTDCPGGEICMGDPVDQPLAASCSINASATAATVHSLTAVDEDGRTVVSWQTASEVGSLGFDLYRLDPESGDWHQANRELLPAVQHTPGGSYRFTDAGAPASGAVSYTVIEVETSGVKRPYGPFTVEIERPSEHLRTKRLAREAFVAEPHAPSASLRQRLALAPKKGNGQPAEPAAGGFGKITVREAGLVRLEAAEVAAVLGHKTQQIESWIGAGRLRVTHRGAEVAWRGDGDGLLFYAEAIDSPFTDENVYWIEVAKGTRMEELDGEAPAPVTTPQSFRTSLHQEQDLLPRAFLASDPLDDFWFWDGVLTGHSYFGRRSLTLEVPDPANAGDATLSVNVWGLSQSPGGPDHRAEIRLNGASLGEILWDGLGAASESVSFGQELLRSGANTVEIRGIAGMFLIDGFDLSYDRRLLAHGDALLLRGDGEPAVTVGGFSSSAISVYDLSDASQPVLVTATAADGDPEGGYRVTFAPASATAPYLAIADAAAGAPADLRSRPRPTLDVASGGDFVILTSAALASTAATLAERRAGQGLQPMVVEVEEVMDAFNDGISDPRAIRTFMAHAADSWSPAPRYLLLAGKGSFDYRDLLGLGGNLVPPLMAATENGLVPADGLYGDVVGDDGLPEIAVGRLPVVSAAELADQIDKLVAYESSPPDGWQDRVMMVADNADRSGAFPTDSDRLVQAIPSGLEVEKIYLSDPHPLADARLLTVEGIRAGAWLVNYLGHGGLDRLAVEGILGLGDVPSLDNGARLPIVTALTCNIGLFAFPGFSSLGEELVVKPDGGAVAVYAPTGLSFNAQAVLLGEEILGALFDGSEPTLGDALLRSLGAFASRGGRAEMLRIYSLLGDPTLPLGN